MNISKKTIEKIWFDGNYIYGQTDTGEILRQSLLWYKRLFRASDEERQVYERSSVGFHWPHLDEDISFESFFYEDAEPTSFQSFFLSHEEINIAKFAKGVGIAPSLLRNYINGWKKPSKERERKILSYIHHIGKEYLSVTF